jgi:hypothetical protein
MALAWPRHAALQQGPMIYVGGRRLFTFSAKTSGKGLKGWN